MKPDYTNIAHTASTQIHSKLLETQTEHSLTMQIFTIGTISIFRTFIGPHFDFPYFKEFPYEKT